MPVNHTDDTMCERTRNRLHVRLVSITRQVVSAAKNRDTTVPLSVAKDNGLYLMSHNTTAATAQAGRVRGLSLIWFCKRLFLTIYLLTEIIL